MATPVTYGNQAVLERAADQECHYCWVGDSHGEPLVHNGTVGQQGIRTRYSVLKNWNKAWMGLVQPASNGTLTTGASVNVSSSIPDASHLPIKPAGTLYASKFACSRQTVSWTVGTLTLTKSGAFTGYTRAAGDFVFIQSGTGATAGWYAVASNTNDTLVLSSGSGLSGSNQTDYSIVAIGTVNTAIDGMFCNDVLPLVFGADVATGANLNTNGSTATFAWFNNTGGDYFSGTAWFQNITLKARTLILKSPNPTTLNGSYNHSSSNAVSGLTHDGAGNTLKNHESTVPTHASSDVRLYLHGGAGSEAGTNFYLGGFMLYKYDAGQPSGFAAGSSWNTVSHAGWTAQNHVDRVSQTALYEWYLNTIPPSIIFIMLGHNLSAAEISDLDGANNGLWLGNITTIGQRHLAAAEAAKAALGLTYTTSIVYVVPWFASAGGISTTARGVTMRNHMVTACKTLGGACVSLFDLFNQKNPLANTTHLHFDAVQSTGDGPNIDGRQVMNSLLSAMRIPTGEGIGGSRMIGSSRRRRRSN